MPILSLLGLSVLELGRGTRQTDRHTDIGPHFPMAVGGIISSYLLNGVRDVWHCGELSVKTTAAKEQYVNCYKEEKTSKTDYFEQLYYSENE